jgi:predicted acetyltransferase
VLSGLHTPHDALYRRYGWERAESKVSYSFEPKAVKLRFRSSGGHAEQGSADAWERLDKIFQEKTRNSNGPFARSEPWWKYGVLAHFDNPKLIENDIVLWVDNEGRDQGYVVYMNRNMAPQGNWTPQEVWIRDFVALTSDAYIGLWEHMKTHDLAGRISGEMHPADPFRHICEDPFTVQTREPDGAMLRIVDVEQAFAQRPFVGTRPAMFTAQIEDRNLAWNNGTWRIEGAEGQMRAERTDATTDVEFDVNALAAMFTGFLRPSVAVATGFARLHRPDALTEMEQVFSVLDAPYCPDYY